MIDWLDSLGSLLDEGKDLVEFGREEVERGEDTSVRAEVVPASISHSSLRMPSSTIGRAVDTPVSYSLLHHLLVVDCISDIDICGVWHMSDGRVEIEDIRRGIFWVEIGVEALHEGRLALEHEKGGT